MIYLGNRGWFSLLSPALFCELTLIAWLILSTPRNAIRLAATPGAVILVAIGGLIDLATVLRHPHGSEICTGVLTFAASIGIGLLLRQRSASPWWLCLFIFHPLVLGRISHGYAWSTGVLTLVVGILVWHYLMQKKPHSRLWGNIAVIAALCTPGAMTTVAVFPLALCAVEWNLAGWLISLLGALCLNAALPGWLFWCLYAVCILTTLWQMGGDLLNPPGKNAKPKSVSTAV